MTAGEPRKATRFQLAPVIAGRAAWDQAVPLVIVPLRLSVPVVIAPPAGALLVVD